MQEASATQTRTVWDRLLSIDRRLIFVLVALAVAVPLIRPLRIPVGAVAPPVRSLYDYINALPPGSNVMIAFNFGPSSEPELSPMAVALISHMFERDIRVIGLSLITVGPPLAERALNQVAAEYGKQRGVDYINLGFKPGYTVVMLKMATDIHEAFPQDYTGTPIAQNPIMAQVRSYSDIALVIDLATSMTPLDWITIVGARYHKPIAAGVTAVMATDFYPYVQNGQLTGLLGGLKGAADYETLVEKPGRGHVGMDAQSMTHLLIIVFVIIGNVAYFATRPWRTRGL